MDIFVKEIAVRLINKPELRLRLLTARVTQFPFISLAVSEGRTFKTKITFNLLIQSFTM